LMGFIALQNWKARSPVHPLLLNVSARADPARLLIDAGPA
jgi:hypothetical protein